MAGLGVENGNAVKALDSVGNISQRRMELCYSSLRLVSIICILVKYHPILRDIRKMLVSSAIPIRGS